MKIIKYFNVRCVFFYNDAEIRQDSFTFIINTVVKAFGFMEAKTRALEIIETKKFKTKIIKGTVEDLKEENIEFLGFHDLFPIFYGGDDAYQTFYNTRYSIIKLKRMLLTKRELKKTISIIRESNE